MPWIMRLNWYDSFSEPWLDPLVMTVEDTRFGVVADHAGFDGVARAAVEGLASVFEPEVVPSAPWQALHFSLETTTRRGCSAPLSATSL